MATIFPPSASVGQEFQGYMYDGTIWNLIGNEYNPTVYSAYEPDNPKPGDLWVDSSVDVPTFALNDYLTIESASGTYLTQVNASSTYATKTELNNIDLSPYLTTSSASSTYATKSELENIDLSSASAAAVSYLVDGAPNALNTLNELAAALNDDSNFATTITNSLASKLDSSVASSTYLTSASMQTVPVYLMSVGGSAQRPVSASAGMFRYNTDSGYPEWYDQTTSSWLKFYEQKQISLEYLVVAGGGGGAAGYGNGNGVGGGGAGGLLTGVSSVPVNSSINITVGNGGSGGIGTSSVSSSNLGNNGQNSIFYLITATGGGAGGVAAANGSAGGSAGGSGSNATISPSPLGQGNSGGAGYLSNLPYRGGGGGGAGSAGIDGFTSGNGGSGFTSTISGSSLTYAAGGGGGCYQGYTAGSGGSGIGGNGGAGTASGTSGASNTGSGGGGGGWPGSGTGGNGGSGGSGVVIIKYPSSANIFVGSGLTFTTITSGLNKITTFTAGTGSVIFS